MVIIETPEEFEALCAKVKDTAIFAIPLMTDINTHPQVNGVCLVSLMVGEEHYIVPFQHNEAVNLPYELTLRFRDISIIMTPDKKLWGHLFGTVDSSVIDGDGIEYLLTGNAPTNERFYTSTMKKMYSLYRNQKNINKAVPLMDLVKYFEAVHAHMKDAYQAYFIQDGVNLQINQAVKFHNNIVIPSLQTIEGAGLCVIPELFEKHYPGKSRNIVNGKVYTEYNPYSLTGRITNTFDGVNYAALPTKDGTRDMFVSRFERGQMVSIDFTSFHPLIIADLIGYTFPEPVYQFLAKQYFNVENPSEEEIKAAKLHTMKLLYDDEQPTDIEFIQKMYDYRTSIWDSIQLNGVIYSPTGRKISLASIENPNPGKLLSYVIQLREMEITMEAISKLLPLWNHYRDSRIVLYTYDSILIDFCLDDGPELLREIVSILEQNGKFPVKIEAGHTFGDLKNVTELIKKESLAIR